MKKDCKIIKNFSPTWFASIMGTGVLAIASYFYSNYLSYLKPFSYFLFYLNLILFFLFLIPCSLRWFLYRKEALTDLKNPIISNFYSTIGIGMLVLAADFIIIQKNNLYASIFWYIGSLFTVLFSIVVPYLMMRGDHVKIDHINPAWFIPPAGLIVMPIAGSLILKTLNGFVYDFVFFINIFAWGSGFFLYLLLSAISLYRFILHKPLPNTLAPTVWISLGPIGAGTVSLINLIKTLSIIKYKEPYFVFSLFYWGFGFWWLIIAIIMTIHYIKKIKLPYSMSWWAFIFPLGVYVVASRSLYNIFNIRTIDYIGFGLYFLLLFIWLITLLNTTKRTLNLSLFNK